MTCLRIQLCWKSGKTLTFFWPPELLGEMFDQKQTPHLIEQKLLDKHHPTWAAKRSNNVGSSKAGTLNPTLSIVWPVL